jgi:hypothetical protein
MKQLESRLQVNEVSNRALLEEVLRLQNELATALRRSFDTIAEERNARVMLENNYKFQTENVLQLNNRLKRTEDLLQEDRKAMQSLILYTKTIEQSSLNTQKDLNMKRDFQGKFKYSYSEKNVLNYYNKIFLINSLIKLNDSKNYDYK